MRKLSQRKLRRIIESEIKGWFKNAEGKVIKLGDSVSTEGIEMIDDAWAGGKNLVDPKDLAKEASGDATPTDLAIMKITERRILKKSKPLKKKIVKLNEKKLRKLMKSTLSENAKVKEFQKLIGMTDSGEEGEADGDWGSNKQEDLTDIQFKEWLDDNKVPIKQLTDKAINSSVVSSNWAGQASSLGYTPNLTGLINFVNDVTAKRLSPNVNVDRMAGERLQNQVNPHLKKLKNITFYINNSGNESALSNILSDKLITTKDPKLLKQKEKIKKVFKQLRKYVTMEDMYKLKYLNPHYFKDLAKIAQNLHEMIVDFRSNQYLNKDASKATSHLKKIYDILSEAQ